MSRRFLDGKVTLHGGDSREVLATLETASVDSVVCDPPYGLEFMGKEWDRLTYAGGNPSMKSGERAIKDRGDGEWQPGSTYGGRQKNPRCRRCGKLSRGNGSCKCPSPDWSYRHDESGFQMQAWHLSWATEAFRVLKPGGHLVAFSGTRTYHRLACAIEDAGFEIRDQLAWAYGSGFPKSLDVSKAIDKAAGAEREVVGNTAELSGRTIGLGTSDGFHGGIVSGHCRDVTAPATDAARQWQGWGTALKPAWEPIVLARKPLIGTVAANVLAHGPGALNIDGCRIGTDDDLNGGAYAEVGGRDVSSSLRQGSGMNVAGKTTGREFQQPLGRWPANLLHDGSEEVVGLFPVEAGGAGGSPRDKRGTRGLCFGDGLEAGGERVVLNDSGSAARFFYTVSTENDPWLKDHLGRASSLAHARPAASSISLQSAAAVSALSHAVATSAVGLTLNSASYRAPSTTVTPSEFARISASVTELMQSFVRRRSLGLPPARLSLSCNLASIAAELKQTGTIAITISPSTSSGSADAVTFDIIVTNSELGEVGSAPRFHYTSKADATDRLGSRHPTVKPIDLMQWLVRLVTPKNGTCLDPFAGTGTTGEAAWREGMRAILIEREEEYQADIARRMELAVQPTKRAAVAKTKNVLANPNDLPLFAMPEAAG
jgi:DNA modification methylase